MSPSDVFMCTLHPFLHPPPPPHSIPAPVAHPPPNFSTKASWREEDSSQGCAVEVSDIMPALLLCEELSTSVYIYVCLRKCVFLCVYMCVCLCVCMRTCTCVCMCYVHARVSMCRWDSGEKPIAQIHCTLPHNAHKPHNTHHTHAHPHVCTHMHTHHTTHKHHIYIHDHSTCVHTTHAHIPYHT